MYCVQILMQYVAHCTMMGLPCFEDFVKKHYKAIKNKIEKKNEEAQLEIWTELFLESAREYGITATKGKVAKTWNLLILNKNESTGTSRKRKIAKVNNALADFNISQHEREEFVFNRHDIAALTAAFREELLSLLSNPKDGFSSNMNKLLAIHFITKLSKPVDAELATCFDVAVLETLRRHFRTAVFGKLSRLKGQRHLGVSVGLPI